MRSLSIATLIIVPLVLGATGIAAAEQDSSAAVTPVVTAQTSETSADAGATDTDVKARGEQSEGSDTEEAVDNDD